MELLSLCKDLIGINSVTTPYGTRKIVAFLAPLFEQLGGKITTQDLEIEGHPNQNLLATFGPPDGTAPLLLNTHLDTVAPGRLVDWTKCGGNPFAATIEGDFLYGLGSADTKLAIACVWAGLAKLIARRGIQAFRQPLRILATAGEEIGLLGAKHAMQTNFVTAKYAIDSEPSGMSIVWAHKGLCAVTVRFTAQTPTVLKKDAPFRGTYLSFEGEAAHSSTPAMGRNAVDALFAYLASRPDLNPLWLEGGASPNVIPAQAQLVVAETLAPTASAKPVDQPPTPSLPKEVFHAALLYWHGAGELTPWLKQKHRADFDPPHPTTALTLARCAGDSLTLTQDLRFIERRQADEFVERLTALATKISAAHPGVQTVATVERLNDAMVGRADSPFVKTVQEVLQGAGLPAQLATKAGCTEGAVFAKAGIETLVMGPGVALNNIHKPNEKVAINQLNDAAAFYEHLIERLCF